MSPVFGILIVATIAIAAFYFDKQRQRSDSEYVEKLFDPTDSSGRRELLEKSLRRAGIEYFWGEDDSHYCANAAEQFARRYITIGIANDKEAFSACLLLFVVCDVFRKRIQCGFEDTARYATMCFLGHHDESTFEPYFRKFLENYRRAATENPDLMHWLEVYVMRILDGPASGGAAELFKENFWALAQNCERA